MELKEYTQGTIDHASPAIGLNLSLPYEPRILIICDEDSVAKRLKNVFAEAGFVAEFATTLEAGSKSARSGRFPVVFSTPYFADGSWRRLIDISDHFGLGFVVVLLARTFDFGEWTEALSEGAFDVLDSLHELPNAGEVAKRALWAAYLKGARPVGPSRANPSKVA
jgi:DNA-binding NtrC family response regulator